MKYHTAIKTNKLLLHVMVLMKLSSITLKEDRCKRNIVRSANVMYVFLKITTQCKIIQLKPQDLIEEKKRIRGIISKNLASNTFFKKIEIQ